MIANVDYDNEMRDELPNHAMCVVIAGDLATRQQYPPDIANAAIDCASGYYPELHGIAPN